MILDNGRTIFGADQSQGMLARFRLVEEATDDLYYSRLTILSDSDNIVV